MSNRIALLLAAGGIMLTAIPVLALISPSRKFPASSRNTEVFMTARNTVHGCASKQADRPLRCDALIKYWQGCQTAEDGCDVGATREVLVALGFNPTR